MTQRRDLLRGAQNDFGPLKEEVRKRLFRYFDDPSAKNWSDIHGIIINARGGPRSGPRTVWQAVIAVDPSFRDIGLPLPSGTDVVPHEQRWKKWPDALLAARAIKAALDPATQPSRHRKPVA